MALEKGNTSPASVAGMAGEIFQEMKNQGMNNIPGMDAAGRVLLEAGLKKLAFTFASGNIDHTKSNAEVKSVKTDLDTATPARTIETYAPIGSNGGALTGQIPVTGSVKSSKASTASQNNSGKIE